AIYIGELTFYTNAGLSNFSPIEWDYKFGELLELPKEKKLEYDFIDKDTLLNQVTNLEPIVKELRDLEEKNIYLKEQQKKLNKLIENHSLFNLFSIFNFSLFAFNIDKQYVKIVILGLKIVFKRKS
ncbi:glycosyl transferase, partial [Brachyspira hyodysenteriae]